MSTQSLDWESYEGGWNAYDHAGNHVIEIDPLQDATQAAKWGERFIPGRRWTVYLSDGTMVHGHSADARAAKKATQKVWEEAK